MTKNEVPYRLNSSKKLLVWYLAKGTPLHGPPHDDQISVKRANRGEGISGKS